MNALTDESLAVLARGVRLRADPLTGEPLLLFPEGRNEIPTARVQENLGQYSPMQFWKLDDLKKHAAEIALIDPTPETLEALKQAGVQVEVRFSKPLQVVYLR